MTRITIAMGGGRSELPENRVYRLKKEFMAVHFERGGNGEIVLLPKGAELEVIGFSRLSECFEVLWEGQLYSLFRVDLLGSWSRAIESIGRQAAEGACA
jgi:hypothetical protein